MTLTDLGPTLEAAGLTGSRFEAAAKTERGMRSSTFADSVSAARWLDAQPAGDRYLGLSPIHTDARPPKGRARDEDVREVGTLLVDCDPADASAEARQRARELACDVRCRILAATGVWPIVVDSGRGVQLWLRHEALSPSDPRLAMRGPLLRALGGKHDRTGAHVDVACSNPSRLARLPGSVNSRTGETARLLDLGEGIAAVADLEALLAELEPEGPRAPRRHANATPEGAAGVSEVWPPRYVEAVVAGELARVVGAVEGTRNRTLNEAAFALGQLEGGRAPLADAFERLAATALETGLGEAEVSQTIGSGRGAGNRAPRTPPPRGSLPGSPVALPGAATSEDPVNANADKARLTDLGNARLLVRRHGADVRFCGSLGWLVWDGRRWLRDDTGEVERRAQDVPRELFARAAKLEAKAARVGGDEAKRLRDSAAELRKHALRSESEPSLRRMVALARVLAGVPVRVDQLDREPFLLTVENGTIELKTGELKPHRHEHLITKLAPVVFDQSAQAPLWARFLARVTGGSKQLEAFLQRVAGYALTADTSEQCFFLLYGRGSNGKSTFLEMLRALLGDYAQGAQFATFLVRHESGTARSDIARLRGARLVSAIETKESGRLDEGLVKQLTGGDVVVARHLYQDEFEFVPSFKLLLAANEKPAIRGSDHGIWRRVRLVPFTVTISAEEKDPHLLEKLRAELPGILRWAVEGCLAWQREGLGEPESVRAATDDYREEQDSLAAFLLERCLAATNARASSSALYSSYSGWAVANGERPVSQKTLTSRLEGRGLEKKRSGLRGSWEWHGIGLLNREGSVDANSQELPHARTSEGSFPKTLPTEPTGFSDAPLAPGWTEDPEAFPPDH